MAKNRETGIEDELELPVFRSSQELDEKILAFADKNLPTPALDKSWWPFSPYPARAAMSAAAVYSSPRPAAWITGLVAASVVGIAVMITAPWSPQELSEDLGHDNGPSSEIALSVEGSINGSNEAKLQGLTPEETEFLERTLLLAQNSSNGEVKADVDVVAGIMPDRSKSLLNEAIFSRKNRPPPERYIQQYLTILSSLIGRDHDELANLYYKKLLLACPQCGLPDLLSDALVEVN